MERAIGFEPTTTCLEGRGSTAELRPRTRINAGHAPGKAKSLIPQYSSRGINRHYRAPLEVGPRSPLMYVHPVPCRSWSQ